MKRSHVQERESGSVHVKKRTLPKSKELCRVVKNLSQGNALRYICYFV